MIENLPKGAIPEPVDERDYKVSSELLAAVNVDWSKEYRVPEPPGEDQDSSDDCVAEAWSYYHWQLKGRKFSRRDLFCRIAQIYGAYIRDGGLEIVKNGQATRTEVKDPEPQTPQNMRDSRGTKQEYREDDKAFNSFTLPQQDINGVAWGIQNYKGVVFGVNGTNNGWKDMKYPRPPFDGESGIWGHALYAMGFHICNDGQKCIIAKSSWSNTVSEHHIRENYFITGNTFNAWTLIPKGDYMNEHVRIINYKGTIYIAVGAKDIPQAQALGEAFGRRVQVASNGNITNADIVV